MPKNPQNMWSSNSESTQQWFSAEDFDYLWGHHYDNNDYKVLLAFSGQRLKMLDILQVVECFTHEEKFLIQHDFPISYQTCGKNIFWSYLSPEINQ